MKRLTALLVLACAALIAGCGGGDDKPTSTTSVTASPLNTLVDIGGYGLHITCLGSGDPTVVIDNGLNVPAETWGAVQRQIAGFGSVCTYDRAGVAASQPRKPG